MAFLKRLLDRENPRSMMEGLEYPLMMAMTLPFILFFIGVCELVSGTPFRQIAAKWNRMGQVKQGVFSFLLMCAGIALCGLAIYVYVRYWA